jgi:DNA-binding HxlR family transcriptional regulator
MSDVMTMSGPFADRDALDIRAFCPIERALELVGTRSAMTLLREAFLGARRFEDLTRRAGVTEPISAKRLKQFVDDGIMTKQPYQQTGQRIRYEYVLTDVGRALFPVVVSLVAFGRTLQGDSKVLELVHGDDCGAQVYASVQCANGHPVAPSETVARIGADE